MSAPRRSDLPCHAACAAITALLEGELATEGAERLEAHLADCPDCARAVARERRYRDAMARLARADRAPESLRLRVARLLDQELPAPHEATPTAAAGRR